MDQSIQMESLTTIVVPCFNESERLEKESFFKFSKAYEHVHFLFVDDGSTDRTKKNLIEIIEPFPDRFSLLMLPQNVGKAEAIRKGIKKALDSDSYYIGFWDADLATPLEEIPRFLNVLNAKPNLFLVTGARVKLLGRHVERSNWRHYFGRLSATLISIVLGIPYYDTQCGAKIFRTMPHLKAIFDEPFSSRWLFDVEIIARLLSFSEKNSRLHPEHCIYELPLLDWREREGSNVKIKDYFQSLSDLLTIRNFLRGQKPHKQQTDNDT